MITEGFAVDGFFFFFPFSWRNTLVLDAGKLGNPKHTLGPWAWPNIGVRI